MFFIFSNRFKWKEATFSLQKVWNLRNLLLNLILWNSPLIGHWNRQHLVLPGRCWSSQSLAYISIKVHSTLAFLEFMAKTKCHPVHFLGQFLALIICIVFIHISGSFRFCLKILRQSSVFIWFPECCSLKLYKLVKNYEQRFNLTLYFSNIFLHLKIHSTGSNWSKLFVLLPAIQWVKILKWLNWMKVMSGYSWVFLFKLRKI